MRIRRAVREDLGRLEGLVRSSFVEGWSAAALVPAVCGREARAWLALRAEGDGESDALGFVLTRRILDLLEIDLVGVDPAVRRGGVARGLLLHLLEVERSEGLVEARLELSARNAPAEALYAGLGFVVVGRRPRYYPDGSDALLLSRAFA